MKICPEHWQQLKTAIEDRGLARFVSGSGEKLATKLQAEIEQGSTSAETFDPLAAANFAIWSNALEAGGPYLLFGDEEGNPYCPVCESEKHGGYPASWWIEHAADEQLEKARAMNLLPPVQ